MLHVHPKLALCRWMVRLVVCIK